MAEMPNLAKKVQFKMLFHICCSVPTIKCVGNQAASFKCLGKVLYKVSNQSVCNIIHEINLNECQAMSQWSPLSHFVARYPDLYEWSKVADDMMGEGVTFFCKQICIIFLVFFFFTDVSFSNFRMIHKLQMVWWALEVEEHGNLC